MPQRYDIGELRSPEVTPHGFLRVDAYLTRTGIFSYTMPDGSVLKELRLPEEVFKPSALDSFALVPVTDNHPPELLTPENANRYAVGSLGERIERDGDFVRGRLCLTNSDVISSIQKGKVQISCGYECDLEMTPGKIGGLAYDAIQRNIRGNHIAIVERGRMGPAVKIKMDSAAGVMTEGDPKMEIEIKIGDKTYMVSEERANEIVAAIEAEQAEEPAAGDPEADKAPAAPEKPATEKPAAAQKGDAASKIANIIADLKKQRDQALARADAAEGKRSGASAETKLREKIRAELKEHMQLEATARQIVGEKFDAAGKSGIDIRKEVIKVLDPSAKLDGKSDDYITARYDAAIENSDNGELAAAHLAAEGRGTPRADNAEVDLEKVRQDSLKELRNRGTAPLTFGTVKR